MNGFPFQKDRERPFMKEKKENRGIKSPGFDCPIDPETTISIAKIELINRKNNTSSEIDDLTIHSDNGNEGRDGTQECALSHFDDIPIYSTILI